MFGILKQTHLKCKTGAARSSAAASVTSCSGNSWYFLMDVSEELPGRGCLILKVKSAHLRWALCLAWHGSASTVRLNSGAWRGRVCPPAEGTQAHGEPLGPSQLYFPPSSQLLRHIRLIFLPSFSSSRVTDGVWIWRRGGRAALGWITRAPGARGARRTLSEWRRWMDPASRWGPRSKFFFDFPTCSNVMRVNGVFAIRAPHSGCAPGDCLWHKRKPSHPAVSRFRRRSFQHKMRH